MTPQAMQELVRRHFADYPLPIRSLDCIVRDDGSYITVRFSSRPPTAFRLSLHVSDELCYLLWIGLPQKHRGKGLGAKLYGIAEAIAEELGCSRIMQTPSGWIPATMETRYAYCLRKLGYVRFDASQVIKHLCVPRK